jgi:hypothetical protein
VRVVKVCDLYEQGRVRQARMSTRKEELHTVNVHAMPNRIFKANVSLGGFSGSYRHAGGTQVTAYHIRLIIPVGLLFMPLAGTSGATCDSGGEVLASWLFTFAARL